MLRSACTMLRRSSHSAAGSPFLVSTLLRSWGEPSSTMAGLEGALLTAGNPLLDISAVVSQELLDKYGVSGVNFEMKATGGEHRR